MDDNSIIRQRASKYNQLNVRLIFYKKMTFTNFYCLLDMGRINAKVFFDSNPCNHNLSRTIFSRNLSFALMKLFLEKYVPGQPNPRRRKLCRCVLCGRCDHFVCKQHSSKKDLLKVLIKKTLPFQSIMFYHSDYLNH